MRDLDFEDRPPRAPRLRDLDLGLREVLRDLRLRQRPVTLLRYWLLLHRLRGAWRDLDLGLRDLDLGLRDLRVRQRPVTLLRYWLLLHRLRGALRDLDFEDLDLDLYLRQRPVIMLR